MTTNLVEFPSPENVVLRGIEVVPENPTKTVGVIMVGGFERYTTTEVQYKLLADSLAKKGVSSFRFDYTGLGLSDGDFADVTNSRMVRELEVATKIFTERNRLQNISAIGHSNSGCIIACSSVLNNCHRVVLLAPSLNQKDLLRYWFTEHSNRGKQITWDNYQQYFKESEFIAYCKKDPKEAKFHEFSSKYHLEAMDKDFSKSVEPFLNKCLLVHGELDDVVPLESMNVDFSSKIIVQGGDHFLSKPSQIEQWLGKATNFLTN